MPEGAVYVGRPTRWGNPWRLAPDGSVDGARRPDGQPWSMIEDILRWYRGYIVGYMNEWPAEFVNPLRSAAALACWCPETCGFEVDLYGVYGSPTAPCTKPVDHDGHHDPLAPAFCHADVLIELLEATA